VVPRDAVGKELGRDIVLLMVTVGVVTVGVVTVGAMLEVIVVGGKVTGGRLPQRTLKSSRNGSNSTRTKIGSIGITQLKHCWIAVSLSAVQRQEIAVQELYNDTAGVQLLVHWSGIW